MILFGNAVPTRKGATPPTFDGWIAMVGPADEVSRLPEREYCSLAGILTTPWRFQNCFFRSLKSALKQAVAPLHFPLATRR